MWKAAGLILICVVIGACATFHPELHENQKQYYIVKPDDNLYSIAFAFEISIEQLKSANPWLSPSNISPGMRISIPNTPLYAPETISAQNTDFIWPLSEIDVSSGFGYRQGNLHAGVDLRAPRGTEIVASAAGRVVFSGRMNGYGQMVVVSHENGIETIYAHNDRNTVDVGQRVKQGQVVGRVGKTGNASGYHVHFEIRRLGKSVNPTSYINSAL